jgi:hypothetical protein
MASPTEFVAPQTAHRCNMPPCYIKNRSTFKRVIFLAWAPEDPERLSGDWESEPRSLP